MTYTLLILIRNIFAGLDGVPVEVQDAAIGMGYSRMRKLFRVDLPLALPTIFAGIRIALVTVIGLNVRTLIAGAVLTETVFAWPGIGRLTYDAIFARDYPVAGHCRFLVLGSSAW